MPRWSTAIVLVAVVATGCGGGSAQPTSPSATTSQPFSLTISGVVRDILQRPIRDARIEIAEGPSLGLAVISDAQGLFSIGATASTDRVALIVSKEGYDTATVRPRAGQTVILLRDTAVANLEGGATIVLTADASCTQLPASLRTRSYTAVVTPSTGAVMVSPATFVGELNGADFYQGYGKMSLTAAHDAVRFNVFSWDAFNWWLEDQPIVERVRRHRTSPCRARQRPRRRAARQRSRQVWTARSRSVRNRNRVRSPNGHQRVRCRRSSARQRTIC